MKLPVSTKYVPLLATALVLIGLYTVGCARFQNFGSLRVLVNLMGDNAFLGVAAVGATFVILSGGIDLSVGAVVAFASILISSLVGHGVSPLVAIGLALLLGLLSLCTCSLFLSLSLFGLLLLLRDHLLGRLLALLLLKLTHLSLRTFITLSGPFRQGSNSSLPLLIS